MAVWRAQIHGNQADLEDLEEIPCTHDPYITAEGNDFYVTSKSWEQISDATEVRRRAADFVRLVDQAARFHFKDTAQLSISGIVKIDDDGRRHQMIFAEAGEIILGGVRARATAVVL